MNRSEGKTIRQQPPNRLGGLYRFAFAITAFNILGHTLFGFEQSWAQPIVALVTAYTLEIVLELLDSWSNRRKPRCFGSPRTFIEFLLSAHITALAISMLLYANDRLMPMIFATAVAICSKYMFRAIVNGRNRHYLNPSNFGITATLILFPWVGIAPPYHFTENLGHVAGWILPALIVCTGTLLNAKFTRKLPLIAAWLTAFVLQAVVRNWMYGTPIVSGLMPMTGVAFVLFTFYMVTDPATTPIKPLNQIVFGSAVALAYGVLMAVHIVFGLFFALTAVCFARGLLLYALAYAERRRSALGFESESSRVMATGASGGAMPAVHRSMEE